MVFSLDMLNGPCRSALLPTFTSYSDSNSPFGVYAIPTSLTERLTKQESPFRSLRFRRSTTAASILPTIVPITVDMHNSFKEQDTVASGRSPDGAWIYVTNPGTVGPAEAAQHGDGDPPQATPHS